LPEKEQKLIATHERNMLCGMEFLANMSDNNAALPVVVRARGQAFLYAHCAFYIKEELDALTKKANDEVTLDFEAQKRLADWKAHMNCSRWTQIESTKLVFMAAQKVIRKLLMKRLIVTQDR
jgi:hypothetical protein